MKEGKTAAALSAPAPAPFQQHQQPKEPSTFCTAATAQAQSEYSIPSTGISPPLSEQPMNAAQQLRTAKHEIARVIQHNFPMDNMTLAIAYGSGVFRQSTVMDRRKMVDLIFAVDNPRAFHRDNIERNASHYSSIMRCLGAGCVSHVQTHFGAKIYYHPFVRLHDPVQSDDGSPAREFKYGVIDVRDLIHDLEHWTTLYCAGRLHKPTLMLDKESIVHCATNGESSQGDKLMDSAMERFPHHLVDMMGNGSQEFMKAQQHNLRSALYTALLLLPEKFTQFELYEAITSLSYMGDVRMGMGGLGEDAHKVRKIVQNNASFFDDMYVPLLEMMATTICSGSGDRHYHYHHVVPLSEEASAHSSSEQGDYEQQSFWWQQDMSNEARMKLLQQLPSNLRHQMCEICKTRHEFKLPDDVSSETLMQDVEFANLVVSNLTLDQQRELIVRALRNIVRRTSFEQTVKGILSAGISRSARYVQEKFNKALASKKE